MTLADAPALDKRLAQAVVNLLGGITALSGVTIRLAETDEEIETPFISVGAYRTEEAIYNSGIHNIQVEIRLNTTTHNGSNSTSDIELLQYDAGIEEFMISQSMEDLATSLDTETEYAKVYNCREPASEATEFTEEKRNILYTFQAHVVGLDS